MGRWKTGTKLALVVGLALGLRIVYICQAAESPLFATPVVDARTYVDDALKMAGGAWAGSPEPFWQPPLYPYFLALLFSLFGEGYYLPRLVQAAAGAITCAALFWLGRRAISNSAAWLAAGAAALYGPLIYFEGELLPVGLAVCLDVLLLLTLLWAAQSASWTRWLLAGLLLGLAGLLVANVFLFAPVVLFWAVRLLPVSLPHIQRRTRVVQVAAFVLGIALVVAPVTLRNRKVGGEWVLVSYNAGVNFYIGNNSQYEQTVAIRPGRQWVDLVNLPEREAGIKSRSAGSAHFFAKSWQFISSDPLAYLGLLWRKVYLFWRGDEIPRNLDPYYARTYSSILQVLLWKNGLAFPFGLIAPLALFGLGAYLLSPARRSPAGSLVLLFTATYAFSVVLFFITARYRLPLVPFLLLFAAHGLVTLCRLRGRHLAASVLLLVVFLLGSNVGVGAMDTEGDAHQHYWMGVAFEEKGMRANALREYRHAAEVDPSHEEAVLGLAAMYASRQRYDEAIEACRQLLDYYPDRSDVRLRLADLFLQKAEYRQAVDLYESLVPWQPDWAALHGRLAYAYLMIDAPDKAGAAYRKILALRPDSLIVRYQLAQLYAVEGREDQAMGEYGELLKRQPDHVGALCHLADLLLKRGEDAAAEPHLKTALAVDPRSVQVLRSMGILEARRGHYETAIKHFSAILALEPDDYLAHRELARLYFETGQKDRSEVELKHYKRGAQMQRMRRTAEEETRKMVEQMLGEGPQ